MNDTGRVIKFPSRTSRRSGGRWGTPEQRAAGSAAARRPRRSKNGTPEERAAKRTAAMPKAATGGEPAAVPEVQRSSLDRAATLARAVQLVSTLKDCHVRDGWSLNAGRGASFLRSIQEFDPNDGDCEHFRQILEWVSDHGQSLDWLFAGDPRVMICASAARTTISARTPLLKLLVLPDPPAPGAA
jgi:hypothetical protein